jgi:ATP-dependent DNA ligase
LGGSKFAQNVAWFALTGALVFEFCLPTKSNAVPDGVDWLHEVKYDGYRLPLERDGTACA